MTTSKSLAESINGMYTIMFKLNTSSQLTDIKSAAQIMSKREYISPLMSYQGMELRFVVIIEIIEINCDINAIDYSPYKSE